MLLQVAHGREGKAAENGRAVKAANEGGRNNRPVKEGTHLDRGARGEKRQGPPEKGNAVHAREGGGGIILYPEKEDGCDSKTAALRKRKRDEQKKTGWTGESVYLPWPSILICRGEMIGTITSLERCLALFRGELPKKGRRSN